MNTSTRNPSSNSQLASAGWLETFRRNGYFFAQVAILTLAVGAYIHLTRLFVGDEILVQRIVTPLFDHILALPMTYAGIMGVVAWRNIAFTGRLQKCFVGFIIFYIVTSIPLHVSVFFTNSTAQFLVVPTWFSVILLPYYIAAILTLRGLKFKSA